MLEKASKLHRFFKEVKAEPNPNHENVGGTYYRIKTAEEYEASSSSAKSKETRKYIFNVLEDISRVCYAFEADPVEHLCDRIDRQEFVDVLKKMLVLNPDFRLTPSEGLETKFVTMTHITGYSFTNYIHEAHKRMEICRKNGSATPYRANATTPITPAEKPAQPKIQQPMIAVLPAQLNPLPTASIPPVTNQPDLTNLMHHYQQMAAATGNAATAAQFFYQPMAPPPLFQYAQLREFSQILGQLVQFFNSVTAHPFAARPPHFLSLATPSHMVPQFVPVPIMDPSMLQGQWPTGAAQQFAVLANDLTRAPQNGVQQMNTLNQMFGTAGQAFTLPQFMMPNTYNTNAGLSLEEQATLLAVQQQREHREQIQRLQSLMNGNANVKVPKTQPPPLKKNSPAPSVITLSSDEDSNGAG